MTRTRDIKKISCIIPAFNEEQQIDTVLDAVLEASQRVPMRIIVVDDGSSDRTPEILRSYDQIHVITNERNRGKSYSVAKGLEASDDEYILLLDSDLFGLTDKNILALLSPIQNNVADITMSIRRNLSFFDSRHDKFDLITGERVFPRSLISGHVNTIKKLPNFALEVYLNDLIIERKCAVKAVHWNNVLNKTKSKKRGFYAGWKENFKAVRDILTVISFAGLVRQYIAMRRLLVK